MEDLPAQKEYQSAVADFLQSLSLRLAQVKPQQFVTLSGVAVDLEIHWPFRALQSSDDQFIHVLARAGALPDQATAVTREESIRDIINLRMEQAWNMRARGGDNPNAGQVALEVARE